MNSTWPQNPSTNFSANSCNVASQFFVNDMSDSASQARDDWYQEAAKSQIQEERMNRAELPNGRVAMLGFLIGLLTELITGRHR